MDFSLSPEIAGFRDAIRRFVDAELIPLEADPASYDEHENIAPELLERIAIGISRPRQVFKTVLVLFARRWLVSNRLLLNSLQLWVYHESCGN